MSESFFLLSTSREYCSSTIQHSGPQQEQWKFDRIPALPSGDRERATFNISDRQRRERCQFSLKASSKQISLKTSVTHQRHNPNHHHHQHAVLQRRHLRRRQQQQQPPPHRGQAEQRAARPLLLRGALLSLITMQRESRERKRRDGSSHQLSFLFHGPSRASNQPIES